MKLHLDNIFNLDSNGLGIDLILAQATKLPEFFVSFNGRNQGFVNLPKVKGNILAAKNLAEKLKPKFDNIAILGIGGSALGITCLRDALLGTYWNYNMSPRLFVLDNLDVIEEFERTVDLDKTLFVVISKSGSTPETMAQFFYFKEKVSSSNFVFITDPEHGELRKMGLALNIPILDIPENVGGRFSVLSPVGLFPAAMLGIDLDALLEGASEIADLFKQPEAKLNLPFQLATVQYLLEWEHGVDMTVMMPYSSRLKSFSEWYAQLLAESIGKSGKGLTPIKALGVTDQHSQLQLYNEGPNNKLIIFIEIEDDSSPSLPNIQNETFEYLSDLSFGRLMHVEMLATESSLTQYNKPNIRISIPRLDEFNLGKLFMLFECSIAFLGEYYRIDAFDQPGVELGKKLTKKMLS